MSSVGNLFQSWGVIILKGEQITFSSFLLIRNLPTLLEYKLIFRQDIFKETPTKISAVDNKTWPRPEMKDLWGPKLLFSHSSQLDVTDGQTW